MSEVNTIPDTDAENQRFVQVPRIHAQRLDDELVIVNPASDTIFTLNRTAAFLWRQLEQPMAQRALQLRLTNEFSVPAESISQELEKTLQELMDAGLIQVHPRAAGD